LMPDIVIIGGGVIGASIAYHLAVRGCTGVCVIDSGSKLGEGTTGRAMGGFQAQFSSPIHVQLSQLSRKKLLRFKDETGIDSGYRSSGYLFCAITLQQMDALRGRLTDVQWLSPSDMPALVHSLHTDDLVGGAFCPDSGLLTPLALLYGYESAARRLGVQFRMAETLETIDVHKDAIVGVGTSKELIATRCVINAAGAWSAKVAEMVGITDLPVQPIRRQYAATIPSSVLEDGTPMAIEVGSGFRICVRDHRALMTWPDPSEQPGFNNAFDPSFLPEILPRARHRIGAYSQIPIDPRACKAGLYDVTPDGHGIVGYSEQVKGFYLANGFNGHGLMHAPAIGQLVAEQILDDAPHGLDITSLRPSRFAEGALNTETLGF
jgi:sarcosine oxidase subunit beta